MTDHLVLLTVVAMSLVAAAFVFEWTRSVVVVIRRRSHRLCTFCGYDRRGAQSRPCPECGRT